MSAVGLRLVAACKHRPARYAAGAWLQASASRRSIPTRNIHVRTELPYKVEEGLGEFLTPEGLKMVAVDYQQGLLDRLNEAVHGTEQRNKSLAQIVLDTAPNANQALAFNYASMALNNDYFLHCIRPPPAGESDHEAAISKDLLSAIRTGFGSLHNLKSVTSAAANGMVSTGWVWFVTDSSGSIGVVATYGAGTLLTVRRGHLAPEGENYGSRTDTTSATANADVDIDADTNAPPPASPNPAAPITGTTPASPTSGIAREIPPPHPSAPARALHTSSRTLAPRPATPVSIWTPGAVHAGATSLHNDGYGGRETNFSKLGDVLFPLFCVSVQEHAWLGSGYGVWGKEEYLKRFWTALDWKHVSDKYEQFVPKRTD